MTVSRATTGDSVSQNQRAELRSRINIRVLIDKGSVGSPIGNNHGWSQSNELGAEGKAM